MAYNSRLNIIDRDHRPCLFFFHPDLPAETPLSYGALTTGLGLQEADTGRHSAGSLSVP